MGLTADQARRFARQIPLIGEDGQAKLCAERMLAPIEDGPAAQWAVTYLIRAGVSLACPRLPFPDDDGRLPELQGAQFAAEAIARLLGERE